MNKPVNYLLYAFAVATVLPMSATTIVLVLIVLLCIKDLFLKTVRTRDFKKDSLLYAAIYLWKAFTRAIATSVKDIHKIKGVWDRVPYVIIGFYKIQRDDVLRIMHLLFAANAFIAVYALGQHFLGIPALYKPLFYLAENRISGYFGHPNQYGGCISIILIMNLCLAMYHDKRFFFYMPFLITGLVFSGSRSYFLGVFICFLVLLLQSRSYKTVLKYVTAVALVFALLMVVVPVFRHRIMDSFSLEKNVYRLNFWKISWNVFLEHPVFGVGSGMLPEYLSPYKEEGLIDNTAHAHNMYLHELAEDGVLGLILVAGAQFYFMMKYFKVQRTVGDPVMKSISMGVALCFVNLLIAGIFENNFGAAIVALNINFLMGVLEGYRLTGKTV